MTTNTVTADWSPGRTRLLCGHPMVARYRGGDRESASSFACTPGAS
jgi:feruloyl esterase